MDEMFNESKIPDFDVTDTGMAFPAGQYMMIFGHVLPRFSKEDGTTLVGVSHENWIIKYFGTESKPLEDIRIKFKEGKVELANRGAKMSEYYPSPTINKNMAWKASAFFSKFGCLREENIDEGDKRRLVDWTLVAQRYGQIFVCELVYRTGKNGKSYRNVNYESIEVDSRIVPADEMSKIEATYNEMVAQRREEAKTGADTNLDNVPWDTPDGKAPF